MSEEQVRSRRKVRDGVVVSNKMDKTVVVLIRKMKPHPLYRKVVRQTTRVQAHDEESIANIGDLVRITETRPLSKLKRWRVERVLEKAK
jgi:small subunit ribosomal protein S17